MKGFPEHVEGSMEPWYQKVDAALAKAKLARTPSAILEVLGEPESIFEGRDDDRRQDDNAPIDQRFVILVYRDPYRKRIQYRFESVYGRYIVFSKSFSAA
jgi:hypothetical protein